jgi:hypothetical protein
MLGQGCTFGKRNIKVSGLGVWHPVIDHVCRNLARLFTMAMPGWRRPDAFGDMFWHADASAALK